MLTVDSFDTLAEAASAMTSESRYLGGGTLIMRDVNYGDQSFRRIVRVNDRNLSNIRSEGGRIVIGAGATMADVMAASETAFLAPVARLVGGPAVRNMATVGGNLFAGHPYGDFTTALLALDALVRFSDGSEQPIESFLSGRASMRSLVASVSVPRPMGDEFRFRKVSRVKPKGVSVMSIAVWLPRQGGRIAQSRIAFGAMGPTPLRAKAAEQALDGANLDAHGIERALSVATAGLSPMDDALASAWYRNEVAPVHLRRVLLGEGN